MIKIINKIKSKKATIGIFGLGYVGLPLALRFCQKNFKVIGFDNDIKKINSINKSKSYIKQIPHSEIKKYRNKKFQAFSNFKKVENLDILIFCLPTPIKKNFSPELKYIKNCLKKISPRIKKGQVFINESTSYPGTTEEYFESLFNKKNLKVGKDVHLVFSPEREDPGNSFYKLKNITKIISGKTPSCLRIAKKLYNSIVDNIYEAQSIKTAEMAKLLENIYRAVNIGLVNEIKPICERMNIDIWNVVNAAKTKPFGYQPFYPGPGVGGHCIPVDPFYLSWKAKEMNLETKFIELAAKTNEAMPGRISRIMIKSIKPIKKKPKILIIGITYKCEVDDLRGSPALKVINILKRKYKCSVNYCDPFVPSLNKTKKYTVLNDYKMKSIKINYKSLNKYDAVCIITNHKYFDFKKVLQYSKRIIDTRGVYTNNKSNKIIRC